MKDEVIKTDDQSLLAKRLRICFTCDYVHRVGKTIKTCTACGCILNFKARLKGQSCPKNKW